MDGNGGGFKISEIFLLMGILFPQSSCGEGSRNYVLPREMTKKQRSWLTTVGFSYFDFWKKETFVTNMSLLWNIQKIIRKKNKIRTGFSCIDKYQYSDIVILIYTYIYIQKTKVGSSRLIDDLRVKPGQSGGNV